MKTPIVMVAFGTTSKAISTYERIDEKIRNQFPDYEILWSFSSRRITDALQWREDSKIQHPQHPKELLDSLAGKGHKHAIVQSLHLFPGTDFHNLSETVNKATLSCSLGTPIICSPKDYLDICNILSQVITCEPQKATLVLGHGTDHPSWTAYYCLQTYLRRQFGSQIYVGVVEKYPDSNHLVDEILSSGFEEINIIPLFFIAGMHFKRDIIGESDQSWQSRFHQKGIRTNIGCQGLGMLEGVEDIITNHIKSAIKQ